MRATSVEYVCASPICLSPICKVYALESDDLNKVQAIAPLSTKVTKPRQVLQNLASLKCKGKYSSPSWASLTFSHGVRYNFLDTETYSDQQNMKQISMFLIN